MATEKRTLFIGQDLQSVADYVARFGDTASGYTTYTSIRDEDVRSLRGVFTTTDYGAGPVGAADLLHKYPTADLQVGLDLVGSCEGVASGKRDRMIRKLGDFIKTDAAGRKVYLRIGYEFDGMWNQYEPEVYKKAFCRIVKVLRDQGVPFATVWQSATSGFGTYQGQPISAWYPGSDYVDVMGLSYFEPHKPSLDALLAFARENGKPVMICESAPQGWDLARGTVAKTTLSNGGGKQDVGVEACWDRWFAPYFKFIEDNSDVIKAVSYINANWDAQNMWSSARNNGYWGDTRVTVNKGLSGKFSDEVRGPGWA
jgi:Glycosyl hydrolase family 26